MTDQQQEKNRPWLFPTGVLAAYNALIFLLLSFDGFAAAGASWLTGQYFLMRYDSIMWPEKAEVYAYITFGLVAVLSAVGHFLSAALFQENVRGVLRWACIATGTLVAWLVCRWYVSGFPFHGSGSVLLPIMISFVVGGIMGFHVPEDKNFMKGFRVRLPFADEKVERFFKRYFK